mgnify:FL=1
MFLDSLYGLDIDEEISNMIKKYGKYFWVLPLLFSFRELYQILYETKGDILDLIMFIGFTYYFWGMSVGKFKGE